MFPHLVPLLVPVVRCSPCHSSTPHNWKRRSGRAVPNTRTNNRLISRCVIARTREPAKWLRVNDCATYLEVSSAASLWLDVELARERAPVRLHLADQLSGRVGRSGAIGGEAERDQPLLDLTVLEKLADLAVDARHDVARRAGRRDHAEPAVHNHA